MLCSSMQDRAGFNWGTFNLKLLSSSVLAKGNLLARCAWDLKSHSFSPRILTVQLSL